MFDMQSFSTLFSMEKDIPVNDLLIEELLDTYKENEEERAEHRRLLLICHDVMRARDFSEVDISLDDLVKIPCVYEDFYELYCEKTSGEMFRNYRSRISAIKSKVRRVL